VLRHGIEMLGLRGELPLAQFKPALGMNPDILSRYAANRLRVVRQVHYSQQNENCIDLVLFLNGIPVATVELKTDFTQSIGNAIDQYRFDRHPKPKGQAAEPLLSLTRRTEAVIPAPIQIEPTCEPVGERLLQPSRYRLHGYSCSPVVPALRI